MPKLGMNAKLFYGTAGATAATALDNVKDVDLDLSQSEIDATTRASGGYKEVVGGLNELAITFKMTEGETVAQQTAFAAIQSAFLNRTAVAILCLNKASGEGPDFDGAVLQFKRTEPLDGEIEYDVSIKPTPSSRAPSWKEASGS